MEALHLRKETLKKEHVNYIEKHPELKELVSDFLGKVLMEKPDNIRAFAKEHFAAFLPSGLPPLVFCGPSGAGKGTLINKLFEEFGDSKFGFSVSHTTRAPRDQEVNGQHYHFVNHETIEKLIEDGGMIEYANVHGNIYGTSVQAVKNVVDGGKCCILDIDIQGAKSILANKQFRPNIIFIAPPSLEELELRLRNRGSETEESISVRMENAVAESEWLETNATFKVINDDLETAYTVLKGKVLEWYPDSDAAEQATEDQTEASSDASETKNENENRQSE